MTTIRLLRCDRRNFESRKDFPINQEEAFVKSDGVKKASPFIDYGFKNHGLSGKERPIRTFFITPCFLS